jgi:hypothetical protein
MYCLRIGAQVHRRTVQALSCTKLIAVIRFLFVIDQKFLQDHGDCFVN